MENLLLPSKIEWQKGEDKNQKAVVIEPCYYGYGTTLGNALRRVLLSSLPGAAVTTVKIEGVEHEFSTLDGLQEDIVELILNLKRLRVTLHGEQPVKLILNAKGEGTLTAADFDKNADVEIANPELVIAHLTDKKAVLNMAVTLATGRGYVPTEHQDKSQLSVGEIAVDSIFTPVVNVGYKVENTRVGQITDYDKLIIYIETDGTVSPEDAFAQAVDIMLDHFKTLKGETAGQSTADAAAVAPVEPSEA
ncbi:DNA-directed RNA polymerase subunit alpha [Candidatus Falkowbacteria bacterium]|nr:DNA-directed RNA polymerase subunit alpha [Candidatus Falkowbacteria bacterium]